MERSESHRLDQRKGLSDLVAALGWRAYNTPEYALFVGALATFPTSARDDLGSEKYTVGPLIATARFPRHSLVLPVGFSVICRHNYLAQQVFSAGQR